MKTRWWLVLAFMVMVLPGFSQAEDLSGRESLGTLRLGLTGDEVMKVLGKPSGKGKDVMWEAIGEWVQEWDFPAKGVTLNMASAKKGGAKTIMSISASEKCVFATARGVRIGSSEAEVHKAYGKLEDKESSVRGESFVAGSLYGGVIFRFEKGRVSDIFIGAAAE
jgi:hypothetical protein